MKIGLAILAIVVVGLTILLGVLALDDFALRRQLARERGKVEAAKSELDGKMQSTSSQLVVARAEVARLTNELAFPIRITLKRTSGGIYLADIFNTSNQALAVSLSYSNTYAQKSRSFQFSLPPGFSRDIAHLGWNVSADDLLYVSCPGYQPVKRVMP
jgi:hypothetical protein